MSKNGRVFISYERGDAEIAASLRQALRAENFDVWWDEELRSGQQWAETIDTELTDAKAIVALWSERSVKSDWVCHEASIGKIRGILTHARIEPVEIPAPFRSVQACDLSSWNNRENDPEFRKLVEAISATRPEPYEAKLNGRHLLLVAIPVLIAASLAAALFVRESPQDYQAEITKLERTITDLRNETGPSLQEDGKKVWRARVPVRLRNLDNKPLSADSGELQAVQVELEPPISTATANEVGFWVVSEDGKFPTARFTIANSIKPEMLDLNDPNRIRHEEGTQEMTGIAPIWLSIGSTYDSTGLDQPTEDPP